MGTIGIKESSNEFMKSMLLRAQKLQSESICGVSILVQPSYENSTGITTISLTAVSGTNVLRQTWLFDFLSQETNELALDDFENYVSSLHDWEMCPKCSNCVRETETCVKIYNKKSDRTLCYDVKR